MPAWVYLWQIALFSSHSKSTCNLLNLVNERILWWNLDYGILFGLYNCCSISVKCSGRTGWSALILTKEVRKHILVGFFLLQLTSKWKLNEAYHNWKEGDRIHQLMLNKPPHVSLNKRLIPWQKMTYSILLALWWKHKRSRNLKVAKIYQHWYKGGHSLMLKKTTWAYRPQWKNRLSVLCFAIKHVVEERKVSYETHIGEKQM